MRGRPTATGTPEPVRVPHAVIAASVSTRDTQSVLGGWASEHVDPPSGADAGTMPRAGDTAGLARGCRPLCDDSSGTCRGDLVKDPSP